jgi:hypothetical protein
VGDIKLTSPRLICLRADGSVLEVQTGNPDLVKWDETARRHKWGDFQEQQFKWLTFIAWAAARRQGLIPLDYGWETWVNEVLEITDANEQGEAEARDDLGTPTGPDLGSG